MRIYRRRNERYADLCILQKDRFGSGSSVMVWAGIEYGYRTPLVVNDGSLNARSYRELIPAPHVVSIFFCKIMASFLHYSKITLGRMWLVTIYNFYEIIMLILLTTGRQKAKI